MWMTESHALALNYLFMLLVTNTDKSILAVYQTQIGLLSWYYLFAFPLSSWAPVITVLSRGHSCICQISLRKKQDFHKSIKQIKLTSIHFDVSFQVFRWTRESLNKTGWINTGVHSFTWPFINTHRMSNTWDRFFHVWYPSTGWNLAWDCSSWTWFETLSGCLRWLPRGDRSLESWMCCELIAWREACQSTVCKLITRSNRNGSRFHALMSDSWPNSPNGRPSDAPVRRRSLSHRTVSMNATHFEWYEPDMDMKQFVSAVERSTDSSTMKMLCRVVEGYQGCDLMHEFSADEVRVCFVLFTSESQEVQERGLLRIVQTRGLDPEFVWSKLCPL